MRAAVSRSLQAALSRALQGVRRGPGRRVSVPAELRQVPAGSLRQGVDRGHLQEGLRRREEGGAGEAHVQGWVLKQIPPNGCVQGCGIDTCTRGSPKSPTQPPATKQVMRALTPLRTVVLSQGEHGEHGLGPSDAFLENFLFQRNNDGVIVSLGERVQMTGRSKPVAPPPPRSIMSDSHGSALQSGVFVSTAKTPKLSTLWELQAKYVVPSEPTGETRCGELLGLMLPVEPGQI